MTNYESADGTQRLSNADRDQAVATLRQHYSEGRLTEPEFGERAQAARTAVTRADLVPLFSDLPVVNPPVQTSVPPRAPYTAPDGHQNGGHQNGAYQNGAYQPARPSGAARPVVMAIVPIVALALFIITGNLFSWSWSWVWFLLVPVAGAIVYGPGGNSRR
jgi:hypothetical protein